MTVRHMLDARTRISTAGDGQVSRQIESRLSRLAAIWAIGVLMLCVGCSRVAEPSTVIPSTASTATSVIATNAGSSTGGTVDSSVAPLSSTIATTQSAIRPGSSSGSHLSSLLNSCGLFSVEEVKALMAPYLEDASADISIETIPALTPGPGATVIGSVEDICHYQVANGSGAGRSVFIVGYATDAETVGSWGKVVPAKASIPLPTGAVGGYENIFAATFVYEDLGVRFGVSQGFFAKIDAAGNAVLLTNDNGAAIQQAVLAKAIPGAIEKLNRCMSESC